MAPPSPSPALLPAPWDPALLAALHTAPMPNNYTGGSDWYMDTGATAHMFAHPGNLASFPTDRRIIVGDGSTLPITHVGHTSFCYLLSTALVFPEEEGMMQQSSVSISLSF